MNTLGINERNYYELESEYKKAGSVFKGDVSRLRPRAERFRLRATYLFLSPTVGVFRASGHGSL